MAHSQHGAAVGWLPRVDRWHRDPRVIRGRRRYLAFVAGVFVAVGIPPSFGLLF
jgi:hypothetical protein